MSRNHNDLAVVGAGPVGLLAALVLARQGYGLNLIEAQALPEPLTGAPGLRVYALGAEALGLLQQLGLWQGELARRSAFYQRMVVWTSGGEICFDAAELGLPSLGAIVEDETLRLAAAAALASAGVRLWLPARVQSIEPGPRTLRMDLDTGERVDARLALACDGADSPLRALAGLPVQTSSYQQTALVATVAPKAGHEHTAWQRFLPGGPLALLPLPEGLCSIVWSLPKARAEELLKLDDAPFQAELNEAFGDRLGLLRVQSRRAGFPLRCQHAMRYLGDRVVLLGDAAHVVHPLAGQGLNLGIADLLCLARILGDLRQRGLDPGDATLLRPYERERRSDNTLMLESLNLIARGAATGSGLLLRAAGLGFSLVDRLGPAKRWLVGRAAGARSKA